MEYSQVILEMLERIKVLENKVNALEGRVDIVKASQPQVAVRLDKVGIKYRSLAEYLLASGENRVVLSYSQIEDILGFRLPDTAKKYKQSYWANTETHSYAMSWLAVGYKARVDTENDIVTFIKNLM